MFRGGEVIQAMNISPYDRSSLMSLMSFSSLWLSSDFLKKVCAWLKRKAMMEDVVVWIEMWAEDDKTVEVVDFQ